MLEFKIILSIKFVVSRQIVMSTLKEPPPVKLFMGLIYGPKARETDVLEKLRGKLGPVDFESEALAFDHSSYYRDEMGDGLLRKHITFQKLIRRDHIVEIKTFTNKLEEVFSYEGSRTVNIDPGYIAQEHVILATGKGFSHRPYLGKGVYADLTLRYIKDEYTVLEWTYPDYGGKEFRDLFRELRKLYVSQMAEESNI